MSVDSRCSGLTAGVGLSRRQVSMLGLLMLVALVPGCSGLNNSLSYSSFTDDVVTGWRDNVWAKRAYNRRAAHLPVGQFEGAFRDGFIDGYHEVAQGGNGCQPAMPPRKYWSWKYQSPEGQGKVNAWFEGFSYGAQAAEEEGLGNYRQIQVSGRVEEQLKASGLGVQPNGCPDCGPRIPGMPLPPGNLESVEPGIEMPIQGSLIRSSRPSVSPAMPPARTENHPVRPASFEVERLPPIAFEQ